MLKHRNLSHGDMNVSTRTISMIANEHDLILDVPRNDTHNIPDRRDLGID